MKTQSLASTLLAGALALGLLQLNQARATTQYFEYGGGANNAWDNTSLDWASASGGPYNIGAWTNGNDAVFEAAGGAVSVAAGGVTVGSMTFNAASFNIQNNTVTLSGTPTITANSDATISSILAGSGVGFTKDGTGKLTLNNSTNSYSGGTTISAGALDIAYKASLGTGLVTLNGGSLQSTTVAAGPLNLTNSFAFNGGTLNYDNTSTSSGTLHIGTGVGATVNIGASGGTINAGRGGNTDFRGEVYVDGQLTGSGPLTNGWTSLSGGTTAYTHLMNNNNSYNGTVTVKGTSGKTVYLNLVATNALQYGTVNFNLNSGTLVGLQLETTNATTTIAGLTGTTGTVRPNQVAGASPAGTYTLNVNNSTDNTFGGTLANSTTTALLALQKNGAGTLTLSGANTFTGGTTVGAGTLLVTNSTGSATGTNTVTVNANGTLAGTGIISGAVTVAAQGTLAAGSAATPGRLTINNSVTLQSGSTNALRINKSGAVLTSDQIAGTGSLALNGALVVTATGDALAQGDTFTLFAKGSYTGFFVASNLPALTAPLAWDISRLTNNGTILVYTPNVVLTPLFSPVAGGYASPQSVTLNSDAGVTVYYTTNAWATTNVYSSPIVLPPNTIGFTISAYGTHVGFSDSAVGTATYSTTPTPTWEQLTDGAWTTAANWSNNVAANGSGITADFSTLTLTANTTVTLGSPQTVGGLLFADQGSAFNWILSGSGPLTVDAGTNVPVINVSNLMTTIGAPIAGTNGLIKNGAGTLAFSAQKTYTGGTTINAGILNLTGGGGASGVIRGSATVNTNGTLQLSTQDAGGYNGGASALTNINLVGGTLNVNTTANQTLGSAAINLTGGAITMSSASGNLDFFGGGSALNSLASSVSSTISGVPLSPLRQGSTVFNVAAGTTPSGIDLDISSVLRTSPSGDSGSSVLIKAGAGTLRLSGVNTYARPTLVSNGTLIVTGTLGTGAVTVSTNATLTGNGSVNGPVTIQSGGIFAPGTTNLDAFTINNTLTLGGTARFMISRDNGWQLANSAQSVTTVTYGGTLVVTNVTTDATPLALGDTFTLFNASTHAGNFSSYELPVLPAGLNWDVSGLQSSGSIAVVNTAATPVFNPPAGNYAGAQSVTISTLTPGATIYYTTDGSTPTASSPVYTTPVVVPAGTNLTIQAYATAAGLGDSPVASATYLTIATPTWSNPAGGSWPDSGSWLAGIVANGSGVTADISTLTLSANTTITLDSKPTVGQILFADQGNAFVWILTNGTGGPLTLNAGTNVPDINVSNQTATITATLAGTNGFAKTGAGTLALAGNVVNTYTGTTTVSNGTLIVDNNNSGNSSSLPNNASGFAISGTSTLTVKSTAGVGGRNSLYGKPITFDATGGGTLSAQSGNQEWCGTMTTSGGARDHFTGTNINMNTGAGTVIFNITRGTDAVSDLDVAVALLNDIAGSGGLVKTGNGILTLAKTNSYTHATTVSNGTLIVNGSLAAGGVTVNAGATLAGTGTIGGATALQSGAQLTPGTASPGTLTFTNTLTLAAGSTTTLRINNAGASDLVSGMTSVTFGGTLTVNNVGGTLALGNTFQLFSATSYSGNFATTNLPALGTGLVWNWNPTAGTLAVVSPVNTTPTNLTAKVAGNVLTLSWPADHTGWRLLVQTNNLTAGFSSKTNDWATVPGSAGINSTNIPVDATKPAEFYRLVYP